MIIYIYIEILKHASLKNLNCKNYLPLNYFVQNLQESIQTYLKYSKG